MRGRIKCGDVAGMIAHCFAPVVREDTSLLILGSLPGTMSLSAGRYYANPRNQFWRLLEGVTGRALVSLPYEERLETLLGCGMGLWDTVAAAERPGSLDGDIRLQAASDIASLAADLPGLRAVAFNGGTAARIGQPQLESRADLATLALPSSSPAYTLPFGEKLEAWTQLRPYLRAAR